MRYIAILIGSSFLLTGCFLTTTTLDRAKEDRMPERLKEVISSYKDSSGNTVIVYKKRYRRSVYKAVVPFDTIISKYNASGREDPHSEDSTLENLDGVYTVKDAKNKKATQQIVLLKKETRMTDTTGLHKEIARNEHLVEKHKGKTSIPTQEICLLTEEIKKKAVSFTVRDKNNKKYLITFQPQRHMPARYLLVPFTVGLDVVSFPIQIVLVFMLLPKTPIS
jgi:hypothetical protein